MEVALIDLAVGIEDFTHAVWELAFVVNGPSVDVGTSAVERWKGLIFDQGMIAIVGRRWIQLSSSLANVTL
jgi:hypothetical protein